MTNKELKYGDKIRITDAGICINAIYLDEEDGADEEHILVVTFENYQANVFWVSDYKLGWDDGGSHD